MRTMRRVVEASVAMGAALGRVLFRCAAWPAALLLGLVFAAPAGAAPERGGEVDLLLVLAVDASNSINTKRAHLQRRGYIRAIADPAVAAAIGSGRHGSIAVSIFEWASPDELFPVIGWTRLAGATDAKAFAEALRQAQMNSGYWTSISAAIDHASGLIETAPFSATRRVIDVSSDGRNNRGGSVGAARSRAVARGITVNGLVVLGGSSSYSLPPQPGLEDYFRSCVIGGPGAFLETAHGLEDFVSVLRRKLVREIAGRPEGRRFARPSPSGPLVQVSARPASGGGGNVAAAGSCD